MKWLIVFSCAIALIIGTTDSAQAKAKTRTGYEPQAGDLYFKFGVAGQFFDLDETLTNAGAPFDIEGEGPYDDTFGINAAANYRLNKHFSVEAGIGIQRSGGIDYTLTLNGATFRDSGNIWMIPVSFSANYHFGQYGRLDPYVGVGAHYTLINSSFNEVDHGTGAFGGLVRAGVHYKTNDLLSYFFEIEQRFLEEEADFFDLTGQNIVSDTTYDPLVITVGVATKF